MRTLFDSVIKVCSLDTEEEENRATTRTAEQKEDRRNNKDTPAGAGRVKQEPDVGCTILSRGFIPGRRRGREDNNLSQRLFEGQAVDIHELDVT